MITLAIANVIWAVMWWITMVYTGNGFLPKMTDGVTYGLFGGHIVSLAMALLFFWQYRRKWKFIKFVTNSQKLFCFFGVTAGISFFLGRKKNLPFLFFFFSSSKKTKL